MEAAKTTFMVHTDRYPASVFNLTYHYPFNHPKVAGFQH